MDRLATVQYTTTTDNEVKIKGSTSDSRPILIVRLQDVHTDHVGPTYLNPRVAGQLMPLTENDFEKSNQYQQIIKVRLTL